MVRSPAEVRVAHGNTCSLLSRADLHQVLGVVIEKTEGITEGADPGVPTSPIRRFAQLRNLSSEQARKQLDKTCPLRSPIDPLALWKDVKQLEGVV